MTSVFLAFYGSFRHCRRKVMLYLQCWGMNAKSFFIWTYLTLSWLTSIKGQFWWRDSIKWTSLPNPCLIFCKLRSSVKLGQSQVKCKKNKVRSTNRLYEAQSIHTQNLENLIKLCRRISDYTCFFFRCLHFFLKLDFDEIHFSIEICVKVTSQKIYN